jgi:hypothetical protein
VFLRRMKQAIETRQKAYKRITDGIRSFVNHSVGVMKLIQEAKRTEIWKERWSSWQEYCEKEFGKSRQRIYELLEVAGTIDEIKSVCLADIESGKNKAILENLNRRQTQQLRGLYPLEKAEVLAKSIVAEGGKSPKPSTIATARADYEIDPADQISKSTPGDVATARMVQLDETALKYPKLFTFEVLTSEEEGYLQVSAEKILVKRGHKNGHADLHDAIIQVCNAYKRVTGKTLSVKPLDAGQLRRLLQSGITLEEFIETGEKAWKSNGFLARQSHQIAMFVKHYGNIRNEVNGVSPSEKNQIRETINVRTL